jgi:hypothetical protein
MTRMSTEEYKAYMSKNSGGSKYHNVKTTYNGILYDSKKEAERAMQLDFLQRAGKIRDLQRQTTIPLMVNGIKVASYKPDFVYFDVMTGKNVIEDVKGMITAIFRLKQKILEANGYKITIT